MPRPWIIDARELDINEPLDRDQVFSTPAIEDFLEYDNKTKTVVAAPKGYGKTLLIKYKRHSYEDRAHLLIPQNTLVDVGPGTAPALSRDQVAYVLQEQDFWATIWEVSIALSLIKHHRPHGPLDPLPRSDSDALNTISGDPHLLTPFQIFAQLLHLNPQGFFAAKRHLQAVLLPAYSQIHRPTAVFIDNIDEFFAHHITRRDGVSTYHGVLEPSYWYHAQLGLVSAIHLLRAQNPHAKVFAAIRIEAFNALKDRIPNAVNLLSQMSVIRYDREALAAIFRRNIELERHRNLAAPDAKDPFERFLGPDSRALHHHFTGTVEPVEDYIWRHTLARPRDLMLIGERLAQRPASQRTPDAVRRIVSDAAREICRLYIGEISPHLCWFDEGMLFPLIRWNVLTRERLEAISQDYNRLALGHIPPEPGDEYIHVFSDLYRAGLLGHVTGDARDGRRRQVFPTIAEDGHLTFQPNGVLPPGATYLIHPVLGSYLQQATADFVRNVDTRNLVAPDAPWRDDDGMRFVAQGDVRDYSSLMSDPGMAHAFQAFFRNAVAEACLHLESASIARGDDILIVDHSPYHVLRAMRAIVRAMRGSQFTCELRFGLDWGQVGSVRGPSGEAVPSTGLPLRRAARLEPFAQPGTVLMTDIANRALAAGGEEIQVVEVTSPWPGGPRRSRRGWDIGKRPGSEKDLILQQLFMLRL
jgi:hypothetical protein